MNQFMRLLLPALFLQLHVSFSLNPLYNTCPPKNCGKVAITYPFYIINQQNSYCGYPGFEVSCLNGKLPILNISGDWYVIRNIWYDKQLFQVVNSAFVGSNCSGSIKNLTLEDSFFNFPKNHEDHIVLFQNCPNKITQEYKQDLLKCVGLAMYKNDPKLKGLAKNCGKAIAVPYENDNSSANITELLGRGVLLNWIASNCTACIVTDGQCGFDRNVSEFKCFCSDRSHAYRCDHPKKKIRGLAIGLSVTGGAVLLAALAIVFWCSKKSKFVSKSVSLERNTLDSEKGNVYFGVPLFSYSELVEATDNFNRSRELGDGGFGTVYHGILRDGRDVAVKRLFEKSYKRVEQFINEVQILTCLRHKHLVSLYGCTSQHCKELLLVYEYVPSGTVADHLYGDKAKPGSLPWHVRMRIALETASALSYLHASEIIHRDVKTNNILLDSNFSVKVADFGLSRLYPTDVTHVSTAPQGTPGYLDPEYHQCYHLTDKSDVYSFGVVLVELISSLPAVDMNRHRQEINLSNYAINRIQQCAINELVDAHLGFTSDIKVRSMTTAVAELAFQCLQQDKEFRPSMEQVLEALKTIESADYGAFKAEKGAKNDQMMESTKPPASPTERDEVKLLAGHQPHPCSPNSVMDNWVSKSTTSSSK